MPNRFALTYLSRKLWARPVLCMAVGLEIVHVLAVTLLPHPRVLSNIIQFCLPSLVALVCLQHALTSPNRLGMRCWAAMTSAFVIWSTAQLLFLYFMFHPPPASATVRLDDALWVLFGLPLLLAITISYDETDRVAWLDRAQAILFFAVLYCLVFLPGSRLNVTRIYLIQNLALLLCCLLRLPASRDPRERRFFLRLGMFVLSYAVSECISEMLYMRGMEIGSLVDLLWTLPIAYLLVMIEWDALRRPSQDEHVSNKLVRAVGAMQGLNVAVLAFLSLGVAAMLATRVPLLGGAFLVVAFAFFALRTNARERLWHEMHDHLEATVLRDALTGLGNRLQLRKTLAERLAESGRGRVVLHFADLDRFKSINDSLGHSIGDRLLVEVGQRLIRAASTGSIVCRLGGDEFVVLSAASSQLEAEMAGEALLQALHKPFVLDAHTIRCTASIGVVLAGDGETANDLLRTADHAMYRAKQLGRDRVQLFDQELRAQLSSRWLLEAELRQCVQDNAIQVEFQPIYSVEDEAICGFEALARWSHSTLGTVTPAQFIPLAEESGLILSLGSQILERACAQMAAWNLAWGTRLSVSVNVSPRQFADSSLIPTLLAILEKTGLPAPLLRLEITETALLTHESVVKHTLEQARQHGIRISLDDFGTGYSSLSFLLSLPVDEVKVDRSFVSHMHMDPDRAELVRTVIHLGHSLGKRVVAEGVETEQDLLGLAEMGCECVQGFLISKPLPAAAVELDLPRLGAVKRNGSAITGPGAGTAARHIATRSVLAPTAERRHSSHPEMPARA